MYFIPSNVHPEVVKKELEELLKRSRFTARLNVEFSPNQCRNKHVVKISNVRLKRKKDYCGQHPNGCVVRLFPKKHIRAHYLEGADWVAFDDMLNDLCDQKGWEADIWSKSLEFRGKMVIRKGRRRRIAYRSTCHIAASGWPHYTWDTSCNDEDFADRVGQESPRSFYPSDTPGIPEWELDKELLESVSHDH